MQNLACAVLPLKQRKKERRKGRKKKEEEKREMVFPEFDLSRICRCPLGASQFGSVPRSN